MTSTSPKSDQPAEDSAPAKRVSRWAIASLISAIAAPVFFCTCIPTILIALGSVLSGHIALFSIWNSEGRRTGLGLAIAGLLIGYPVLIGSGLMAPTYVQTMLDINNPSTPRGALNELEKQVTSSRKGSFHGNNKEAELLAKDFSEVMGTMRDIAFGEPTPGVMSLTQGEFVTCCELRHDRCLFLVHVPDYRNFNEEERKVVEDLCWTCANMTAREKLPVGSQLAVGLRGVIQYGAVMTGEVTEEGEVAVEGRKTQTTDSDDLFPFVQPVVEQAFEPKAP